MNVYPCHYRGMTGYCCRAHNSKWMFVPELGQVTNAIIRIIALDEIDFDNVFAKCHELLLESERKFFKHIIRTIIGLLLPGDRLMTSGGKLFAPIA